MKSHILVATCCATFFAMFSSFAYADDPPNPIADPAAIVVSGNARFTILTPGLVRMEYSDGGKFEDRASFAFINRRLPVPKFEKADRQGILTITTEKLSIRYRPGGKFDKSNLTVQVKSVDGQADLECAPPFANPSNLGGTTRTLDGISGSCPLEEGLLSRNGWTCVDDSKRLLFAASPDNALAGARASLSDWPWATPREKKDSQDWYFFAYGHDYKGALADFIKVAGRIPMPPRFAFGAWWSRYWAYSDAELRQLVKEFREHDVPLDVLVVDMDWHLDGWTGYTWNPKYFPDPNGFLKWAHAEGLKVTLNLHPAEGVGKQEKQFPEVCKAMGLDPKKTDRVPFDCTDRTFVDAYFKLLHHPMEKAGIDFWWMDWQQGQKTKIEGLDPLFWLNYLHWTEMERRTKETGERPIIFSRWGGLGNHRYQIGFSGDTFCNWPSLAFQPPFTATAGNVGYAYWSHDIGGHQPGKVDPEMYVRWLQWGALSPILRTHTTKNPEAERRIWQFPTEFFEAGRKAYQLRYELIPYIYTAARQCYDTGIPLCRPLYYEWPELDEAYKAGSEYLFGDQMLVAPVAEAADPMSQCAMVEVWLPPGKWVYWPTGRMYEGPKTIPLTVPLDEIPIFVRDGGIVVTQDYRNGASTSPNELVVNVFGEADGSYRLYEDDGVSNDYTTTGGIWTEIAHTKQEGRHTARIGPASSERVEPRKRKYDFRFHHDPKAESVAATVTTKKSEKPSPLDSELVYIHPGAPTTVRLAEVDTTSQVEIMLTHRDAAKAAFEMNREGATGKFALLKHVAAAAPSLTRTRDAVQAISTAYLSDPTDYSIIENQFAHWAGYVEELSGAKLSDAEQKRLFARLLGLFYRLNVVSDPNTAGVFDVAAIAEPTILFDPTAFNATLTLKAAPGWRLFGAAAKAEGSLAAGKPLSMTAKLVGDGTVHTAMVSATLTVSPRESKAEPMTFEFEKILMPSINAWWIVGPLECRADNPLDQPFLPEERVEFEALHPGKDGERVTWKKYIRTVKPGDDLTGEFFVDFDEVFSKRVNDTIVYGFTYIDSPEDMDATFAFGTDDGVKMWLNGEEIYFLNIGRPYSAKSDHVAVKLKKGTNTLLVKVHQGGGDGGFGVHIEDANGRPLTQVKPRLKP